MSLCSEKILWVNGGFPAALQDRTIFKTKGLLHEMRQLRDKLGSEVRIIADDGYFEGKIMDVVSTRNEFDSKEVAWFKDRALSRQEKFNGRTKTFAALSTLKFGHSHALHGDVVRSVCVAIQIELDEGITSLFDPYP